jgi:molybdenum cofactor synthesis domain-containing protein
VSGKTRTAAALIIGNEILSGKVQDANLLALAVLLRRLGVQLRRVVMVLDEIDTIAEEVRALSASHDFVFTSGGVGPTHDDVTMEGIAAAFGVKAVVHPEMERMLRDHYGDKVKEGHLRMALVPDGATLEISDEVRWPLTLIKNVFILPGVPEIFRMKLAIAEKVVGKDSPFLSRAVYTNMDEGTLKPLLDAIVRDHTEVDVGSYPTWSDPSYRTKLTFDGKSREHVDAAVDAFVKSLPPGEPQRVD